MRHLPLSRPCFNASPCIRGPAAAAALLSSSDRISWPLQAPPPAALRTFAHTLLQSLLPGSCNACGRCVPPAACAHPPNRRPTLFHHQCSLMQSASWRATESSPSHCSLYLTDRKRFQSRINLSCCHSPAPLPYSPPRSLPGGAQQRSTPLLLAASPTSHQSLFKLPPPS